MLVNRRVLFKMEIVDYGCRLIPLIEEGLVGKSTMNVDVL